MINKGLNNIIDNPNFRRWFGYSKVVDSQGNPMVVFHGTKSNFNTFKHKRTGFGSTIFGNYEIERYGIFAAEDPELAYEYVIAGDYPGEEKIGHNIMPLFMKIESPLDTLNESYSDALFNTIEEWGNEHKELFINKDDHYNGYRLASFLGEKWGSGKMWNLFDKDEGNDPKMWIKMFKDLGYDGLRIYDRSENASNAVWVAFEPSQVKSAIANKEFSDSSDNILKENFKRFLNNPNFKKWFGNSVIKDKDGNPIPMYHGTKEKNLTKFDRNTFQRNEPLRVGEGFYFTDSKHYAVGYAINHNEPYNSNAHLDPEVNKRVGEYYIKLENPAPKTMVDDWRHIIKDQEEQFFYKLNKERGKDFTFTSEDRKKTYDIVRHWSKKMREFLESKGYDGYIAVGQIPNNMAEVVVFYPEQIKSTSNIGTFNSNDSNFFKEENKINKNKNFIREKWTSYSTHHTDPDVKYHRSYPDDEWRGPHAGVELSLLLKNKKPVAILELDNDINKAMVYIKNGTLIGKQLDSGYWIVSLPKEKLRMERLAKFHNDAVRRIELNIKLTPQQRKKLDIQYGLLLGYSKEDIRSFINNRKYTGNLFEQKLLLQEKTLYHGTLIDNIRSIEKHGLIPSVGKFVKDAYESDIIGCDGDPEDYLKELVFATDKEQLDKAITAITAQISQKLNKNFHDVTDDEFIRHGALVIVKDGDSIMTLRPRGDDYYGEHPYTAEPGDYYSEDYIGVDYVLTGNKMISFLKYRGHWPRFSVYGKIDLRFKKDFLIKAALKRNPNKTKEEILKIINSWDEKTIDSYYQKIRGYKKMNETYCKNSKLTTKLSEIKSVIRELINENIEMVDERLTFGDMIDDTDDERIFKSKLPGMIVRPLQVSTNNDKDMWRFDYSYTSNEKSEWERYGEKKSHKGHIYFFKENIDPEDNLEDLECMVDCSCRDFRFRWAYVLAQQDSSIVGSNSLNKSTNAPPIKTNPQRETKLCKHLSALQKYLITNIEKSVEKSHLRKRPMNIFESMNELTDKGKFNIDYYDEDK